MRQNIVTMFGQTPAFAEPCATMGLAPRMAPIEANHVHLVKEFLASLQTYVGGHVQQKLFDVFGKPVNRTKFYKYTKKMEPEKARQVLRSIGKAGNSKQISHVQGRSRQTPNFGSGFKGHGSRGRGHRGSGRWVFKLY
ncbi:hypothetical protein Y032_0008g368 [Ancylostoma ceylanicum]|uniref:Uncharacterized protein n=1 Tax=Ancylostoma ceylanicum TaxID=53326 RepID=A0A016VKN3_9BILA|nr:hypothetical protein Y032_0008g368 [Ancylostoma ceylanicum]